MELFSAEWFTALTAIIVVDLLLAGDNAIVIAMAAKRLPGVWRRRAIIWGTAGAIVIRVVLAFFVTTLLQIKGIGLLGGLVLYFIAWRLLNEKSDDEEKKSTPVGSFWAAMWMIMLADTVMGLDNILAIAGAAAGDFWLITIGLLVSIPIMMGGSALILAFLNRMPWLTGVGCALLAGIAGRIIMDDPIVEEFLDWTFTAKWSAIGVVTIAFTAAAWHYSKRKHLI